MRSRNPLSRVRLQLMSAYYDAEKQHKRGAIPYGEVLILGAAYRAVDAAYVALELSRKARGIVGDAPFDVTNLVAYRFKQTKPGAGRVL